MDEQTLISAAQRGDLEAFNELVLLYQDLLFRIAVSIMRDENTAADVTQQALLSAFCNLRSFRGNSLRSWLSRIVVNACYDEIRRISRTKTVSLQMYDEYGEEMDEYLWLAAPEPSPEAQTETSETLETIQSCLQALSEPYRTVVLLVDVEGLSYEEASAALRIPIGTVKSRLARARNALRKSLRRYPDLIPAAYSFKAPVAAHIC